MFRVKIKCKTNTKDYKLKLLEIFWSKDVEVNWVIPAKDSFAVLTLNEDHADCIFKSDVKKELAAYELYPELPPELKVKKV